MEEYYRAFRLFPTELARGVWDANTHKILFLNESMLIDYLADIDGIDFDMADFDDFDFVSCWLMWMRVQMILKMANKMNFDTIRGPGGLKPFEYTTFRVRIVKFFRKIVKTTK